MLCEMKWVSSRIWTRVAVVISYDDNNYITGTSQIMDIRNVLRTGMNMSLLMYGYVRL